MIMKEEYIKQVDGSWIKRTTQEEVVNLDKKQINSEIAYCNVQIDNARALIEEMQVKKQSLKSIRDVITANPSESAIEITI